MANKRKCSFAHSIASLSPLNGYAQKLCLNNLVNCFYFFRFQVSDSLYNGHALRCVGKGGCETLKFIYDLLPRNRARIKPLVVLLLYAKRATVFERDPYAARHLGGEAFAQCLIRPDGYRAQQALYILTHNALRLVLCRRNLAVQQCDRNHIGQAVICFFLGMHLLFVSLFSSADDVIRDIKNVDPDALNLFWMHMICCAKFQNAL